MAAGRSNATIIKMLGLLFISLSLLSQSEHAHVQVHVQVHAYAKVGPCTAAHSRLTYNDIIKADECLEARFLIPRAITCIMLLSNLMLESEQV